MTYATLVMYAVAAVFAVAALVLLLQLRGRRSERGRYARLMTGVMCAAFATMLVAYASAMWSWNGAS